MRPRRPRRAGTSRDAVRKHRSLHGRARAAGRRHAVSRKANADLAFRSASLGHAELAGQSPALRRRIGGRGHGRSRIAEAARCQAARVFERPGPWTICKGSLSEVERLLLRQLCLQQRTPRTSVIRSEKCRFCCKSPTDEGLLSRRHRLRDCRSGNRRGRRSCSHNFQQIAPFHAGPLPDGGARRLSTNSAVDIIFHTLASSLHALYCKARHRSVPVNAEAFGSGGNHETRTPHR